MFKYFPTNYVWNLSVAIAIENGGRMGEIVDGQYQKYAVESGAYVRKHFTTADTVAVSQQDVAQASQATIDAAWALVVNPTPIIASR